MPRKKKGKGATSSGNAAAEENGHQNGEYEELESDVTDCDEGVHQSKLETAVDQLLESRATTREKALTDVTRGLALAYSPDFVNEWYTTITEGIMRGLKKGREEEQVLALRALGVVAITMGTSGEDLYREFAPVLAVLAKDAAYHVRAEAIGALAITCFVSSNDDLATREHVAQLEDIISQEHTGPTQPAAGKAAAAEAAAASATGGLAAPSTQLGTSGGGKGKGKGKAQAVVKPKTDAEAFAEVKASALQAWCLLTTTLDGYIETDATPRLAKVIAELMNADDLSLCTAAGEALALIFDIARAAAADEEGEGQEDFDIYSMDGYVNVDDVLDRLRQLATLNTRYTARKDRIKVRASFKEILNSIEDGKVPSEVLSISGQKITFDTWPQLTQLNFVRTYLAEGTQQHLEKNELLQEIFDYTITGKTLKVQSLSRLEKRMFMSPNSAAAKKRTKNLAKARQNFGRKSATSIARSQENEDDDTLGNGHAAAE